VFRGSVALLALTVTLGGALGGGPVLARDAGTSRPGAAGVGDPYFPLDGNGGIDVGHYDVRDAYDFATGVLSGRTTLRVTATQNLSRFDLDFLLPVTEVRVDGAVAGFSRHAGHELRIEPQRAIPAGRSFRVTVTYEGQPRRATYLGESNWLAGSHEVVAANEPHMAPWWFPANDHPSDKATMDVRITVPRSSKVISNGLPVSRHVDGPLATTHWRSTEPMVTYAAFFAAGAFSVRKGELDGRPYVVAVSRALRRQNRSDSMGMMLQSPALTSWLESQLGPYPFASTGGVVTDLNPGFALETQGRPTYAATGSGSARLLVHELAHQWFGDSVSIARWRDIVLNEGFATFMEQRWTEVTGGVPADQWLDNAYEGLRDDATFWTTRVDDPGVDRLFDLPVYLRGAMSVQALRNRVGEDDFWSIVRTWLSTRAGGNGSTGDFVALAESTSGEDLDAFFDAWWHGTVRPAKTAANGLDP
jgi:aminopeptidase N